MTEKFGRRSGDQHADKPKEHKRNGKPADSWLSLAIAPHEQSPYTSKWR